MRALRLLSERPHFGQGPESAYTFRYGLLEPLEKLSVFFTRLALFKQTNSLRNTARISIQLPENGKREEVFGGENVRVCSGQGVFRMPPSSYFFVYIVTGFFKIFLRGRSQLGSVAGKTQKFD